MDDITSLNPFFAPAEMTNPQLLFQTGVYAYALFQSANFISEGSELLLLVPAISTMVGSVVLPVLGAVPDAMMVLFSAIGSDAQQTVSVGVGALAGSTIMLLTIPWFLAVFGGRVTLKTVEGKQMATYKKRQGDPADWEKLMPPNSVSLTGTGVSVGNEICANARLMFLTTMTYVVVLVPGFFVDNKNHTQQEQAEIEKYFALFGAVLCFVEFLYYLYVQWNGSDSDNAQDTVADKMVRAIKDGEITLLGAMVDFQRIVADSHGKTNEMSSALIAKIPIEQVRRMCKILAPFYAYYDQNHDNQIDFDEFRMILTDLHEIKDKETVEIMFKRADTDQSGYINFEEFVSCLISYALEVRVPDHHHEQHHITAVSKYVEKLGDDEGEDDEEEDEDVPEDLADLSPEEQQKRIKLRSLWQMGLGTALVLGFSSPMVDCLAELGHRVDLSPFYISFVLAPLASNASELVAAYNYAQKRTQKTMTISLSTLEGAACMNNTFCLGVFLFLVYSKELAWQFTSETIIIIAVEVAIAIHASRSSVMSLGGAVCVLAMYPLSLGFVWFLESKVGLD